MLDLIDCYGALLRDVDTWFHTCSQSHPEHILCRDGCSSCCRGLFDVTLLDALYLKQGVDLLPAALQHDIMRAAESRLSSLSYQFPFFIEPWLLNGIPEEKWDQLMPEEDETPCVLLSGAGRCLVYNHRPMTCRLNGIPLIDVSGEEFFDEWCSLNFKNLDPRPLEELRYRFHDLFSNELELFQKMTGRLVGRQIREIDLFIPAAAVLDIAAVVAAIKNESL
ncbi:MAG TPA: YkgJ family cysteine cluster protein [Desulfuromonadales bacterium]|nr:YkgJ family cysteine cluster protein [Desulfuromonadales bacterium]